MINAPKIVLKKNSKKYVIKLNHYINFQLKKNDYTNKNKIDG